MSKKINKFKALTFVDLMADYSKKTGKPCMYISFCFPDNASYGYDEVVKAAPYLKLEEHGQIICDGGGILIYNTIKEMEKDFWKTVGDDGPTKTNKYNGPAKVYALTCINGVLMNENT